MFCPKCAQSSPDDQKFCRSCGFSLHEITPLLSDTSLTSEQANRTETKAKKEAPRLKHTVTLLVLSFVVWIVLLAARDMPGLMPALTQILRYLSVAFFGLVLSLGLYIGVKAFWLWQFGESKEPQPPKAKDLPAAKATTALPAARESHMPSFESRPEPVPSVTERTTNLLSEESRKR